MAGAPNVIAGVLWNCNDLSIRAVSPSDGWTPDPIEIVESAFRDELTVTAREIGLL